MSLILTVLAGWVYVAALSGCATIVRGTTQEVRITSEPAGATVTIRPGGVVLTTPAKLKLPRSEIKTLQFDLADHDSARAYIDRLPDGWAFLGPYAANLILGGFIGMLIDLSNQHVLMYELDPRDVHVVLEPAARVRDPEPSIGEALEVALPLPVPPPLASDDSVADGPIGDP